jgi:uncharacterized membrane protein
VVVKANNEKLLEDRNLMATITTHNTAQGPDIREVEMSAVSTWLLAGWRDFRAAPLCSLVYGVLFTAAMLAILLLSLKRPWFSLSFFSGLLLLGPFLAAGTYVASRQMETGEKVSISAALRLLRKRSGGLALIALLLLLLQAAWIRLAALLIAFQSNTPELTIASLRELLATSPNGFLLIINFVAIGFVFASLVFVFTAVAIPLIVDRGTSPINAMLVSANAVRANRDTMLMWAAIIVLLTLAGMVTAFIPMVVIFPVLGYATWHSYRGLLD